MVTDDFSTIERIMSNYTTNSGIDLSVQALLLKLTRPNPVLYSFTHGLIKTKRAEWLAYLTEGQRQWQARESRGHNYDGFAIREEYVCPRPNDWLLSAVRARQCTAYWLKIHPELIPAYWNLEAKERTLNVVL